MYYIYILINYININRGLELQIIYRNNLAQDLDLQRDDQFVK